jgi:hypothetical protein
MKWILIVLLIAGCTVEPEPVQHIELPDNTEIQVFDIADHCGEQGCIYVVRAEWVYLSRESAEEKVEEWKR